MRISCSKWRPTRKWACPLHAHFNEEEHFIVVDGTLQIAVGGEAQNVPPGGSVTVGKGVPHAWCNLTDAAVRFIVVFTPGRIEGMFRAVAEKKVDDVEAFAGLYGTRIIGRALHSEVNTYFKPRRKPEMSPHVSAQSQARGSLALPE